MVAHPLNPSTEEAKAGGSHASNFFFSEHHGGNGMGEAAASPLAMEQLVTLTSVLLRNCLSGEYIVN